MPKSLTIKGQVFEIPSAEEMGYTEGRTIDAAEARHLYQVRCENVRNNAAKKVEEMLAAGQDPTQYVQDYNRDYTFSMPGTGAGRQTRDPVEAEHRRLLRAAAGDLAKAQGKKLKDFDDERVEAVMEQIAAQNPDLLKKAQSVVKARQKKAELSLEGIQLGA